MQLFHLSACCAKCSLLLTGYTVKLFCRLLSTDVCGYASAIVNLLLNSSLFTVFREYAAIYCMLENVILSFSVICPTLAPPPPSLDSEKLHEDQNDNSILQLSDISLCFIVSVNRLIII